MSTPTDDLEAIKNALNRASARIGCPPGDNADADLYRELSHAAELVSRLAAHLPTSELVEAGLVVHEALRLGLRVATEIRRTSLPGPIHPEVLGAIHTFERACDPILSAHPKEVAPTVEKIEQAVVEWCMHWCERVAPDDSDWTDLHARLKALSAPRS